MKIFKNVTNGRLYKIYAGGQGHPGCCIYTAVDLNNGESTKVVQGNRPLENSFLWRDMKIVGER